MTNEEWDRKVEFLLNQQARFDAGMQQIKEAQAANDLKLAEAAATAARAAAEASHAAISVTQVAETLTSFINATKNGFQLVFDTQRRTEEKLQDLAGIVERQIREGHHGLNGT